MKNTDLRKISHSSIYFPWLLSVFICCVGVLSAFWPTISSGFQMMQTDPGDTRLNMLFMEQVFHFCKDPSRSMFSPPFFFPEPNVSAYSDLMFVVSIPYIFLRLIGVEMYLAYQLWMIVVLIISYIVFLLWFHFRYRFSIFASTMGAYLFAFGAPRVVQMGHQQLLFAGFVAIALFSFVDLILFYFNEHPLGRKIKQFEFISLPFLIWFTLSAQFISGFYLAWFCVFILSVLCFVFLGGGIFNLLISKNKSVIASGSQLSEDCFFANKFFIFGNALGILSFFVLTYSSLKKYLEAAKLSGFRSFEEIWNMIPVAQTWFFMGKQSLLFSELNRLKLFRVISPDHEQRLGIGILTSIICGIVVFRLLKQWFHTRVTTRIIIVSIVFILVGVTKFQVGSGFTLWNVVFEYFPGAQAVRAVSRIGLMFLIVSGALVVLYFEKIRLKKPIVMLLSAILFLEQVQVTDAFNIQETKERVDRVTVEVKEKQCSSFFYSPDWRRADAPFDLNEKPNRVGWKAQLDAMTSSFVLNVPTINGYSGKEPLHWNLYENEIFSAEDEVRISNALKNWISIKKIQFNEECWIKIKMETNQ